jgi:ArsR family transcriptional regulator
MNRQEKTIQKRRVAVFKALAHPSRLYIVMRLSESEACVGDLTKEIGADVSTVSKHLAVLRDAGLVADRRDGQNIVYSLACSCILDFMHCVDAANPPEVRGSRRGAACSITRDK